MKKLSRALMLLGFLALALALMFLVGHRSSARRQLQQYKAELRAKGEKLTYAELVPVRATNNYLSYVVLSNVIAAIGAPRFNPTTWDAWTYARAGEVRVCWQEDNPPLPSGSNVGTYPGTWAEIAAQLQNVQGRLQELRVALKDPAPDAGPRTNIYQAPIPKFVAIRESAQWLTAATINDLHEARSEEALQNLEALAGLAHMGYEDYILVAQMIRVAVANLGLSATWQALQSPGWTEPQLERLQNAWAKTDLLEAVEMGFVGERVSGGEIWELARQSKGRQFSQFLSGVSKPPAPSAAPSISFQEVVFSYGFLPAYKFTSIDEDELLYLQTVGESITALRLIRRNIPGRK